MQFLSNSELECDLITEAKVTRWIFSNAGITNEWQEGLLSTVNLRYIIHFTHHKACIHLLPLILHVTKKCSFENIPGLSNIKKSILLSRHPITTILCRFLFCWYLLWLLRVWWFYLPVNGLIVPQKVFQGISILEVLHIHKQWPTFG